MESRWKTKQGKDLRRRQRADGSRFRRRALKAQVEDARTAPAGREEARQALRARPRDTSLTRACNRCVDTGRGRSVRRVFRRSRFVVRDRALRGRLPGVLKV